MGGGFPIMVQLVFFSSSLFEFCATLAGKFSLEMCGEYNVESPPGETEEEEAGTVMSEGKQMPPNQTRDELHEVKMCSSRHTISSMEG